MDEEFYKSLRENNNKFIDETMIAIIEKKNDFIDNCFYNELH